MNQRSERDQGRADAERQSTGVIRLFGQMMLLPFTVFVYSMDLFVRTMQGMQRSADQGMDAMAGGAAQPSSGASAGENHFTNQTTASGDAPPPGARTGGWNDLESQKTTSTNDGTDGDAAEVTHKETVKMSDKNLSDDDLKLVRYKILFVKRDYEVAFPEREELIHDNITGEAFTAWKIAEFIQRLDKEELPERWKKKAYPERRDSEKKLDLRFIHRLDEDDKKYLRVYYEVLERYVREEDDSEVDVLKDIRKAIDRLPRLTYSGPASGTGTGTGGGGTGSGSGGHGSGGGTGSGGGYQAGSAGGGRGFDEK